MLVDWDFAERVAAAVAGEEPSAMRGGPELERTGRRAETAVLAYTGLEPEERVPTAEWVSRREWAAINLGGMRSMISEVEGALERSLPGGERSPLGAVAGRVLAVEIGALLGLASRRVLGQYEFGLLDDRAPRLLFVGPNIDAAVESLGGSAEETLEWVALHEVTHAVQMAAAPWVRPYLGERARELLQGAALRVSPAELASRARGALSSDPRRMLDAVRESDPLRLIAPESARGTLDEVQAAMSLVEGYAEHVMDAAAGEMATNFARMRRGMDARREGRSAPVRLLLWILGLEAKLRQYREGKAFADGVADRSGIGSLNLAWAGPEALPTNAELSDPDRWIGRVTPADVAV